MASYQHFMAHKLRQSSPKTAVSTIKTHTDSQYPWFIITKKNNSYCDCFFVIYLLIPWLYTYLALFFSHLPSLNKKLNIYFVIPPPTTEWIQFRSQQLSNLNGKLIVDNFVRKVALNRTLLERIPPNSTGLLNWRQITSVYTCTWPAVIKTNFKLIVPLVRQQLFMKVDHVICHQGCVSYPDMLFKEVPFFNRKKEVNYKCLINFGHYFF